MIKLGSHISFKGPDYLLASIKEALSYKANTLMIYLGPPQSVTRVDVSKYHYEEYLKEYASIIPSEDIIIHAPYIVNAASKTKAQFARDFIVQEIKRMNYIHDKYLVLHPGAFTSFSLQESLDILVESIKYILDKTKDVIICLETMAGKGTEVFTNFDQILYVINKIGNDRVQICLDTCHIWDAGYDIKNYDEFKKQIKENGILKHIKVIHLNDSKNPLGAHKDRHANIGQGFIGLETLRKFVHDPDFDNVNIILETPWTDNGPIYKEEIAMLLK